MAVIKVMDEMLANKIAAGEVVEKCVSVVKELVENSIDALSTDIKIELIDAGTKQVKITDNGKGMDKDDAVLAFSRHATSKLSNEDDLFHIDTLGFRGEALASIAAVSEVELKTSTGAVGTKVEIKGGKIINVSTSDSRQGTIITISNLFFNTPARLKHLKSLYTELANIIDYINKIALSYPSIKFTLINNNKTIFKTNGNGSLLKTIKDIFGLEITKQVIEVHNISDDYKISGYVGKPVITKNNRNNIITLVNGRVVRNTELNRVIIDAYHTYIPDNKYPIIILKIEVDPILIDVNIHPTKMDIKFSKFEELATLIETTIKDVLTRQQLIPQIEVKTATSYNFDDIKLDLERMVSETDKPYQNTYQELSLNDDLLNLEETLEIKRLPELYPVGVVLGTYIICQNETGMYLIDQHAAKERINYELYKNKLSNPEKDTVAMMFPLNIELKADEFIIIKENFTFLESLNFKVEEFGLNSIIIKEHPTWLPVGYEDEAIKRIIDLVITKESKFDLAKFNDNLSATIACKLSIKANDYITLEEMEKLIDDLRKCENPFNCPHGRPTIIHYSKYELEKEFKRVM